MAVVASRVLGQRIPGFDRDLAVGLWRQRKDDLRSVDVTFDAREAFGWPLFRDDAVE